MKLEYGTPTDKNSLTVRLGIEKGFFQDEGIDLSVRVIFGGPPLAAAYDSNELQFGESRRDLPRVVF
jgi:ABC-type nitrate/sulfonate/bicarbonate transport system substrate-binding protein